MINSELKAEQLGQKISSLTTANSSFDGKKLKCFKWFQSIYSIYLEKHQLSSLTWRPYGFWL